MRIEHFQTDGQQNSYGKNEKDDISDEEKRMLKKIIK